uniref:Ig-like domain-containing protein n=1 Tax=Haplochromis burtoni TaxID=8153 RepID=A0A3Q2VRR6_HAPBU
MRLDIGCSFKHPSRVIVLKKVWFTKGNNYNPYDLKTDPAYAGRLSYSSHWKSDTLTIRDLRESDSAVYKFRFETDWGDFTGLPGVTLNVTAIQLHVDTSSYSDSATLTCQSSCRLHDRPSYIWYKNGQKISTQSDQKWYPDNPNPSDSYSCAVRGHEDFPSPSVCEFSNIKQSCRVPSVTVSPSVEGSSVTLTCSSDANPAAKYTWYKEQQPISQEKQITFRSTRSSDSGEYYCTAENEVGRRSSEVISIKVKCESRQFPYNATQKQGVLQNKFIQTEARQQTRGKQEAVRYQVYIYEPEKDHVNVNESLCICRILLSYTAQWEV